MKWGLGFGAEVCTNLNDVSVFISPIGAGAGGHINAAITGVHHVDAASREGRAGMSLYREVNRGVWGKINKARQQEKSRRGRRGRR